MFVPSTRVSADPGAGFSWPSSGRIVREFEKPTGPYGEGGHQGVDIAADPGSIVKASSAGTVEWVGELPRGKYVTISHPGGVRTTYLGLDRIDIGKGDTVCRGQAIATVSGGLDNSSPGAHLHFDTYVRGSPVDPRVIISGGGLDTQSFIRLCPVDSPGGPLSSGVASTKKPGVLSSVSGFMKRVGSELVEPFKDLWRYTKSGAKEVWGVTCKAALTLGRVADRAWDGGIYKALIKIGSAVAKASKWIWSNKWVQAIVAGVVAAIAAAFAVFLIAAALVASTVAATVAVVAAALFALGMALYYAATCGANFDFAQCFLKSFSAGILGGTTVLSLSSLSGAFSAGWANLGIGGTVKTALWNGGFSALFDGTSSYLFTGRVSARDLLVAFSIGALSGAIGKVLKEGLTSSRFLEVITAYMSEGKLRVVELGSSLVTFVQQKTVLIQSTLLQIKDVAVTVGTKAAYLVFNGTLGASLNAVTCKLTGRPIVLSGILASFATGVVMAGISLSFQLTGISGLLEKFAPFREGLGRLLKGITSRLIEKSMRKGINFGLKEGFRKLLGEKEVLK